jgi:hypothetical protein
MVWYKQDYQLLLLASGRELHTDNREFVADTSVFRQLRDHECRPALDSRT